MSVGSLTRSISYTGTSWCTCVITAPIGIARIACVSCYRTHNCFSPVPMTLPPMNAGRQYRQCYGHSWTRNWRLSMHHRSQKRSRRRLRRRRTPPRTRKVASVLRARHSFTIDNCCACVCVCVSVLVSWSRSPLQQRFSLRSSIVRRRKRT